MCMVAETRSICDGPLFQNSDSTSRAIGSDCSAAGLVIARSDLDRLVAACFVAAVGVMLALCMAVLFWPAPVPASGSHAIILDFTLGALRIEPREKAFFALAVTIGFSMGLA